MKISVIIPIYNIEDCLERCVKSVINQTYKDLEIILVDDGSTDKSPEIVDRLALEDSRIKAFHKSNGGSSSARNLGIKNATGEYLGFVDSDDYIESDMYEKLVALVQKRNLKIAQIGRDEVAADGSKLPDVVPCAFEETIVQSSEVLKELLLHKGDCSFCTKLTKKELFDAALFPEGELNEDFWLLIQFLNITNEENEFVVDGIGIVPAVGYHVYYRETSNSRTVDRTVFPRVYTDIVVNADRMEELIANKYPELSEYACRFALVQRLDYLLHIPVGMMNKENTFYIQVVEYLRKHKNEINNNIYINDEQKKKLKLLRTAPKLIREIHLLSMKMRGIR